MNSELPVSELPVSERAVSWRTLLVGLVSGGLFAVGLALAGMTDPGKVLGFLDVAGAWDPTLAWVMGGAVGFHFLWLRFVAPRLGGSAPVVSSSAGCAGIDARLLAESAIFGVGWGLSGYCPGPALVTAAYGRDEALWFSLALLAGIALFRAAARSRNLDLFATRGEARVGPNRA